MAENQTDLFTHARLEGPLFVADDKAGFASGENADQFSLPTERNCFDWAKPQILDSLSHLVGEAGKQLYRRLSEAQFFGFALETAVCCKKQGGVYPRKFTHFLNNLVQIQCFIRQEYRPQCRKIRCRLWFSGWFLLGDWCLRSVAFFLCDRSFL